MSENKRNKAAPTPANKLAEPGENKAKAEKPKSPTKRGASLTQPMPTSGQRAFLARAEHYKIAGRTGDGPCTVLDKGPVALPNGDLAIKGDTFNPVVENMAPNRYGSLVSRGYITSADAETEKALLKAGG